MTRNSSRLDMSRTARFTLQALISLVIASSVAAAQTTDTPVPGSEFAAAVNLVNENTRVAGEVFVPAASQKVRAVIALIGQASRDEGDEGVAEGLFYEDFPVHWRRFTQTCDCALLLAQFSSIRPSGSNDAFQVRGGAEALLLLLGRLADVSAHRELRDAPLLLLGWSAEARFVTAFAETHPERTIAYIQYHMLAPEQNRGPAALKSVPALLIDGGKDVIARVEDTEAFWKRGRSESALWAFAVEPNAAHGYSEDILRQSNELMFPWMAAVIRMRLPAEDGQLRPIQENAGWLGNNRAVEVAPYRTSGFDKTDASWLPDETAARSWRTLMQPNREKTATENAR